MARKDSKEGPFRGKGKGSGLATAQPPYKSNKTSKKGKVMIRK